MSFSVEAKGTGKPLTIETGTLAKQASGSVVVRQGDSVVLVTATASKDVREGIDFLPLVVEYQEMSYAAGRIKGGFIKRDGRAGVGEILTARCIDRPIRPLFPKGLYNEIQVIAMVISADPDCNPDIMAINGASAALQVSSIPFDGPIGATRVGLINGEYVTDPSNAELENSDMELIVVGTRDAIVMVEGEAEELSEEVVLGGIEFARKRIDEVIAAQDELKEKAGKEKWPAPVVASDEALYEEIKAKASAPIEEVLKAAMAKHDRAAKLGEIRANLAAEYADDERKELALEYIGKVEKATVRKYMKGTKTRIDGRNFDQIRPISCQTDLLPRAHGSAVFTRGETQALAITTLGTPRDEQRVETLQGETTKAFMLHYQFPPFCVGEARMLRGPSRREIGHGNLAERALSKMLPSTDEFPYTIRLVSEVLESNGSSSMASVCGGSMALMSAGVPVKKQVAGIAMGLIKEEDDYMILSDILGDEDHLGDMDFKVAGTTDGITALQMDIKIAGLPHEVLTEALERAKAGRNHILGEMDKAINAPAEEISAYAPRVYSLMVKPDKIRDIIGPGGKMIKEITAKTDTKIEIDDSGKVEIFASDMQHAQMAIDMINELTEDLEIGKVYAGKVAKIMDFGAFVDFPSGASGLVHISQLANERVQSVRDVVEEGDDILVKVIGIDERTGKVRLSRKEALPSSDA